MIIMKDKSGKPVEIKEFFSRWKQGMKAITPLQITTIQIIANAIMLFGVVIGLTYSWAMEGRWLFVILCGSFLLITTNTISSCQRYIMLQEIESNKEDFLNDMKGGLSNE